jgi:DnaB-like helicase C terminal domain
MMEVFNLDYDEEILSHLPDAEAWLTFRSEGFNEILINDEDIREIFRWQDSHLREHGKPATASVLAERFDIEFSDPETSVGELIDKLRERYINQMDRDAFKEIQKAFEDNPTGLPRLLIEKGKELDSILGRRVESFGTGDYDRAIRLYHEKLKQGPGPSIGFKLVDDHFYGQRGLTFYVGPPKTWKSWFMIEGVYANVEKGIHSWLYSLELPAEETDMRLRCRAANLPWWKYVRNAFSREDETMADAASEMLDEKGVYRIVKPPQGERTIDDLVGRAGDAGATVVFIDQLQFVEVDGQSLGAWNETGKYWKVLDHARNISDEIPICFAHQFNRSTMGGDSMPDIKQAKGSSAIEETATLALGLWANKDMRQSSQCELGTLIARNSMYQSWEVGIELSQGCSFEIIGRVEE